MLRKSQRLDSKMVRSVLGKGKYFGRGAITIKCAKSESAALQSRFSIVVPAKTEKRAVYRNKIKRAASKALEELLAEKGAQNSHFCVIFVRTPYKGLDKEALKKSLEETLKTARVRV